MAHEGPKSIQGDLFAGETDRTPETPQVDIAEVRRRLGRLLADLKEAADQHPWSQEADDLNRLIIPQMAAWLPDDERNHLLAAFDAERRRLSQG